MRLFKFINLLSLIASGTLSLEIMAAPQVSSLVMGSANEDTVVNGQNFDSFDGVILRWDDFEQHTPASNIYGLPAIKGGSWTTLYTYKGKGLVVDTARAVSGSKSVLVDWSLDKIEPRAFGFSGETPFSKVYITYWRYMTGDFIAALSNHKQFYLYGNKSGFPQGLSLIPAGAQGWGFHPNFDTGAITSLNLNPNNFNNKGWNWLSTNKKFQRWEYYIELNNPYTVANGVVKVWMDGKLGINNTAYKGRNVDGQFVDFRLGHMATGFNSSAKAWFDDVYVSTTQARIEICNSDVYSNCTIKQLQYVDPSDWSPTKIAFKLRNLAGLKGSDVYLYVIDKNGDPSNPIKLHKPLPPTAL